MPLEGLCECLQKERCVSGLSLSSHWAHAPDKPPPSAKQAARLRIRGEFLRNTHSAEKSLCSQLPRERKRGNPRSERKQETQGQPGERGGLADTYGGEVLEGGHDI